MAPGDVMFGMNDGVFKGRLVLSAMGGFGCPYGSLFNNDDCTRLYVYDLETCGLKVDEPTTVANYETPQPTHASVSYSTATDMMFSQVIPGSSGRERIRTLLETPRGIVMATNGPFYSGQAPNELVLMRPLVR